VVQYSAGLRFFYVKTLKRHYMLENIPLPKEPRKLPTVLSPGEVTTLIESASNLMHRAILMTLYATGMRRAELCQLKVTPPCGVPFSRGTSWPSSSCTGAFSHRSM
jgi:integrase/recombinase XerD